MKAISAPTDGHIKVAVAKTDSVRPRMTKRLAEKRAVGGAKSRKFDGVIFLRSFKK